MLTGELSSQERGIVVAALLDGAAARGSADATARVLSRIAEPARSRCLAVLTALVAGPRDERVRTIVHEVRRAVALPPALRDGVHPSWFEAPLAGDGAAVRAAARGERAAAAPVRRWLLRSLWGQLVPMPPPLEGPPVRWADVPRLAGGLLERTFLALGRGQAPAMLAPPLAHAGGDVLVQTAQKLPRELGELLLAAPRAADSAGFSARFAEFCRVMAGAPR